MDINISADQMRDIVSKAIFDSVTPEERERILKAAIVQLLTPEKPQYGRGDAVSPLEVAMKSAAHTVATQIANQRLAEDAEFKANIESLFQDVARKLFATDIREKLVQTIAEAVVAGLKPRDY